MLRLSAALGMGEVVNSLTESSLYTSPMAEITLTSYSVQWWTPRVKEMDGLLKIMK